MCLNNKSHHSFPVISSLRALAKQSWNILKCYWKQYNNFWCRISSAFMVILVIMIGAHHKMDAIGTSLLGFLIPLGAGIYKAHDDKDKKNEPVFKGRRKCFHDLRNIVWKLYSLSSKSEDFTKNKHNLEKELSDLYIKAQQYFDRKSRIFNFIDQTRNAAIHYLYGVNQSVGTDLQKAYTVAKEFLHPFLREKEFLNRRREFELDMFKPETFAPIWARSFDELLK